MQQSPLDLVLTDIGAPSPSPSPSGGCNITVNGDGNTVNPNGCSVTINGNDNCVANSPGDCQKTEDDKDPTFWSDLGEIGLASAVGFAIGAAACGDGDPIICTLGELTGGAAIAPVFATAVVLGQIYRDTAGDGKHNPVIEVVKSIGCFVGLC